MDNKVKTWVVTRAGRRYGLFVDRLYDLRTVIQLASMGIRYHEMFRGTCAQAEEKMKELDTLTWWKKFCNCCNWFRRER